VQVSVPASGIPDVLLTRTIRGAVTNGGTVDAVSANGQPVAFANLADGTFEFTLTSRVPGVFTVSITASIAGSNPVVSTFDISVP
jgi:hypothetical protein